ncbi:MAG: O-antigen ligase family protein [Bacteroidota bacterium]
MKISVLDKRKIDVYLLLIVVLIILVFNAYKYAFIPAIPILIISYYRILIKNDITSILILMLISRLIMGPFLPRNSFSFNVLNLLCNYVPIGIFILRMYGNSTKLYVDRILKLKWTLLLAIYILVFSLYNLKYSLPIFPQETLPLILFLLVVLKKKDQNIDFDYLLLFLRYTFVGCIIVYLHPDFGVRMSELFSEGIIFKEASPDASLFIKRTIPRNTGFVFDFRILGQLACIYILLLYYLGKKHQYADVILLFTVALITFSRGPIVILLLISIGIYAPRAIRLTKKGLAFLGIISILGLSSALYLVKADNEIFNKYIATYNPYSKENAISQRGMFIQYSLDKFYEKPFGNGIGYLSTKSAGHRIFVGYKNRHREVPDKVYYYKVADAFLAMSLAEKGIIGFVLFLLSTVEIFFANRNRVSLLFLLGFMINLIGTDIPKQGFYYFVFIIVYYGIGQAQKERERAGLLKVEAERL